MHSILFGLAVAALIFAGGVGGMFVNKWLPDHLIPDNSRDLIKFVIGLTTTLSALVLSLLVASSYSLYNSQKTGLETLAARSVQLDRVLESYGPEAAPGRALIKIALTSHYNLLRRRQQLIGDEFSIGAEESHSAVFGAFLGGLEPTTDRQRRLLSRAYELAGSIQETRDLLTLEVASPISVPLLVILSFWTTVLFFGYGLLTHINPTAMVGLGAGALVLGCAIFLILELSEPYAGVIRVPTTSLAAAITAIDQD
jgi:hypothetical protein